MGAPPLLVVGLDGATFDVLHPLAERGELPHLSRLMSAGLSTELRSTQPPATLPAWTSFLTGMAPDRHGVTDLFLHPPGRYDLVPATGAVRRVPTFARRLSDAGKRVVTLGVPGTFPPEPISGLSIAGFDAPGRRAAGPEAVWPPEAYQRVLSLGGWRYATFNEQRGGPESLRGATAALLDDLDKKQALVTSLMASERPWDVFCVHLQATDTAGHHLWHTWDARSPRHLPGLADALPSVYRRCDALVGALLRACPEARVLVVSDHGMGGASDVAVYLNRFLAARGLLRFSAGSLRGSLWRSGARALLRALMGRLPNGAATALAARLPQRLSALGLSVWRGQGVDFAASQAFSDELDYAPAVWLNRRGVFSAGRLSDAEGERLAERLAHELVVELRHPDSGEPLIRKVHRRRDLYDGPAAELFPDLLVEPAWPGSFRPSFLVSRGPGPAVRRLSPAEFSAPRGAGMPGVHRREGIFLAAGPELPALELPALDIAQAGAFVYPLVGLPPPEDCAALPPHLDALARTLCRGDALPPAEVVAPTAYDPAGEAAVTDRLRSLGYIE